MKTLPLLFSILICAASSRADVTLNGNVHLNGNIVFNKSESASSATPLVWFKFDETTGSTATDSSGNGRDGALHGDAILDAGGYLDLDGSGDYVSIADLTGLATGASPWTVTFWAELTTPSSADYYAVSWGADSTHDTSVDYNGSWRVNSGSTSSGAVTAGQWYFIAVTYDGSVLNVYRDNVLKATQTITLTAVSSVLFFYIGARANSTPNLYFKGSMDDVRVFNSCQDTNGLTTIYNDGLAGANGHGQ